LEEEKSSLFSTEQKKELAELISGTYNPAKDLNLPHIYHGDTLKEAWEHSQDEKVALITGLLYDKGVVQWFADDGLGKSVALLCAMLEASYGKSVFDFFEVPKPLRIIWECAERPLDEPFERTKTMQTKLTPNPNNLVFDKEWQNFDVRQEKDQAQMLLRLAELSSVFDGNKFDVLCIDPIYALVSGGLKDDEGAHSINSLIRKIQNRFECAIIYNHHTNRGQKKENSEERFQGDMYGSRFLRANLTGQYHLIKTDDGIDMKCTKNTYGNLMNYIPLIYDELSNTLSMAGDMEELNKKDRILIFLRKKRKEQREFYLREISNQLKVSDAYIRKIIQPLVRSGHIKAEGEAGKKATYKVEKDL
jgi:RecA-family ATPase